MKMWLVEVANAAPSFMIETHYAPITNAIIHSPIYSTEEFETLDGSGLIASTVRENHSTVISSHPAEA